MTKRDFELIAEILAYRRTAIRVLAKDTKAGRLEEQTRLAEVGMVVSHFAGQLGVTNPNFDRDLFLKAAGVAS